MRLYTRIKQGDTPTVPTVPTQPTTPDNSNNGNADGSTGDAATAPSTESGEGATTGDTARPVVYAVLAMMAAGLVLSVVVYDNKKKRIQLIFSIEVDQKLIKSVI